MVNNMDEDKQTPTKPIALSFRLDKETYEKINLVADKNYRSLSSHLRYLVEKDLQENEK